MTASHLHEPSDDARLQDLLDGRLEDAAADALRARIAREPALAEAWEELRTLQALVRGHGPAGDALAVPEDFLAGVRRRITAEQAGGDAPAPSRSRSRPGRYLRLLTVAYAAAALLVVGFTVRYVLEGERGPARETQTADEDVAPLEKRGATEGMLSTPAPAVEPRPTASRAPPTDAFDDAVDADGRPAGGGFAPGGAVPPGVRPPAESPAVGAAEAPGSKTVEPPPAAEVAKRGTAPAGVVYVLEVVDLAQGRRALADLLAAPVAKGGAEAARGAGSPRRRTGTDSEEADAERPTSFAREARAVEPRLFRLAAGDRLEVLARLVRAGDARAADKDGAPADGLAAPSPTVLEVVDREVDATTLARLEARAQAEAWGRPPPPGGLRTFVKKARKAAGGDAPSAAAEAPAQPEAERAEPEAPAAPAPPAKHKAGAPPPARAPAADAKAERAPVRVRIVLVERRR